MHIYLQTDLGNEFSVEAFRIIEPENNLDEVNVTELYMNDIELNFDQLTERNQEMIYNKIWRH